MKTLGTIRLLNAYLIFCVVLVLGGMELFGQIEFSIELLDLKKGLPSNFASKTVSDGKQFKYFATEAGISRYDGYTFKNYRPEPGSTGLLNENIETLLPAKNDFLWVGTKIGGLSRLNLKTQTFENWNDLFANYSSRPQRVVGLAEDKQGNLWVGTWSSGCFKVDVTKRKVVEHFPTTEPVYGLLCDAAGTIWYGDGLNLCAFKNEHGTLQRFTQSFYVFGICEDTVRKRIWLTGNSDFSNGLAWCDQLSSQIYQVPINFKARFVSSIAIDKNLCIWLGSWRDGLYVSNPSVDAFKSINTTDFAGSVQNSNHKAITNLYIDKNGIIWVCTSYGGVLILYQNKGFKHVANNSRNFPDLNIASLGTGANGNMLAGSFSDGLFTFGNPEAPLFNKVSDIPSSIVYQVYDKNNELLIGTSQGLYVYEKASLKKPRLYFPQEKITSIAITSQNYIWLGLQQHGLIGMPFNGLPDTPKKVIYSELLATPNLIENDRINKMVQDKAGRLWLVTHSGLNLWHPQKRQFISHNDLFGSKLPRLIIHDLIVDGNYLYLATPKGLYKVAIIAGAANILSLKVEELFDEQNALFNQFICALQKDKNGNIWFSSISGISKLNTHTHILHHFGKRDGVQINAFHINSSYQDSKGNLFFGGDNGFVYFNPETVVATYEKPEITLTELVINNETVNVNTMVKGQLGLKTAIQYTKLIQLDYQRNHLTLRFTPNDFLGGENISYAYKLEPKDNEWVLLRDKNEIHLSGLSSGNYSLKIRANRNNQGWGNSETIKLNIQYPPWMAWYAWLFYFFLVMLGIFTYKRIRQRQTNLQLELQKVQFEKEKEHEINEAKINFFTNISHEFRTPLTLILSPSTELLESNMLSGSDEKKVTLIKSNAQKLLRLINQLLDFRKSEHGLLVLRRQRENIRELLSNIVTDFSPAATAKRIALSFNAQIDNFTVEIDKSQIEIAINNLISNALKFTASGGRVDVNLAKKAGFCWIEVADTGIGMAAIHLDKIFNRFYQVPNGTMHQGGSGIGLAFTKNIIELHKGSIEVNSELGKGTIFTIRIPLEITAPNSDAPTKGIRPNMETEEVGLNLQKSDGSRETIIVIDDNDDIRSYLASFLAVDYTILEAENGSVGYKLALEIIPDLIISDIMMPEMDGIELCAELKGNMATSHIPIILLTARASEAYELTGLQTGADDYITKPFNPLIMKMRVRNMLDSRNKLKSFYLKRVRFQPESNTVTADNLDEVFLNKAIELVNENLQNENFGIEVMVDHLFMSQSTLFRKIKSLTGLSITGFIRAIRLKRAAQLILQTNLKMSDIAQEVGFNDYKYFKKSFQQQFGCLPSEYREDQSEKKLSK